MAEPVAVDACALPGAFEIADETSLWGQRMHLRLTVVELSLLILGAFTTLFVRADASELDIPQLIGAVLFVGALGIRAYRSTERFEQRWFQGRAAAESVKSLAWRYAVGGHPFPVDVDDDAADREFIGRLREVVDSTAAPMIMRRRPIGRQITDWMRTTCGQSLEDRTTAYRVGRIEQQRGWYASKAYENAVAYRRWNLIVVVMELVGFGVGLSQAVGAVGGSGISAMAVMAAVVAAITAWSHAKQFGSLAAAYTQAEQELLSISELLEAPRAEAEWAEFVQSAETAISREHRMWQSSRAVV